jgi:hypothetical protein
MAYGDIMDRLNDTRPVKTSNYNSFIPDGHHDLVVASIESYTNQEQNFCVRTTFIVEGSDNPQAAQGAQYDALWNLDKPAPFPGGERDKDRFAAFMNALQGVETTPTSHQALARACLKTRAEGGQLELQPCRGARIKASGYTKPPKEGKKPYTRISYTHVPQEKEAVIAMRQALDQRMPYTYRPQQAPASPVTPTPAPVTMPTPVAAPATNPWTGFFPPK